MEYKLPKKLMGVSANRVIKWDGRYGTECYKAATEEDVLKTYSKIFEHMKHAGYYDEYSDAAAEQVAKDTISAQRKLDILLQHPDLFTTEIVDTKYKLDLLTTDVDSYDAEKELYKNAVNGDKLAIVRLLSIRSDREGERVYADELR